MVLQQLAVYDRVSTGLCPVRLLRRVVRLLEEDDLWPQGLLFPLPWFRRLSRWNLPFRGFRSARSAPLLASTRTCTALVSWASSPLLLLHKPRLLRARVSVIPPTRSSGAVSCRQKTSRQHIYKITTDSLRKIAAEEGDTANLYKEFIANALLSVDGAFVLVLYVRASEWTPVGARRGHITRLATDQVTGSFSLRQARRRDVVCPGALPLFCPSCPLSRESSHVVAVLTEVLLLAACCSHPHALSAAVHPMAQPCPVPSRLVNTIVTAAKLAEKPRLR